TRRLSGVVPYHHAAPCDGLLLRQHELPRRAPHVPERAFLQPAPSERPAQAACAVLAPIIWLSRRDARDRRCRPVSTSLAGAHASAMMPTTLTTSSSVSAG